ncbi:alpha-1,2-fucosyltransferase [Pirellulaceae bacterium SH467]
MHRRKPVVKLLLCGGLGNQLFQYAFARCLALRTDARLILDTKTLFQTDTRYRRTYELDAFKLSNDVEYSKTAGLVERIRVHFYRHVASKTPVSTVRKQFIEESQLGVFDNSQYNLLPAKSITLKGYWQCPMYFESIETILRDELSIKKRLMGVETELSAKLNVSTSVGIHVRRNDYARCLSAEYYRVAMQRIRSQVINPQFFVFSDDYEWWNNQFGDLHDVHFISRQGREPIDDFHLLSLCTHFIIPNSTFSWWAAWLGRSTSKIVIAPSKSIWVDSSEILPKDWQIIEVQESTRVPADITGPREYEPVSRETTIGSC